MGKLERHAKVAPGTRSRPGISLLEIVLGALIIGVSAIPILELMRSSTAALDVTVGEAAARCLASDVLERYANAPRTQGREVGTVTKLALGAPVDWRQLLQDDPYLSYGFPPRLGAVLDKAELRISLDVKSPYSHRALGTSTGMECVMVTASWKDNQERSKEVTLVRLVDRH